MRLFFTRKELKLRRKRTIAGIVCLALVAAYTYGFPVAEKAFKDAKVPLVTLTNYEAVMEVALRTGYIEEEDVETLNEWRKDPAHWESGK